MTVDGSEVEEHEQDDQESSAPPPIPPPETEGPHPGGEEDSVDGGNAEGTFQSVAEEQSSQTQEVQFFPPILSGKIMESGIT